MMDRVRCAEVDDAVERMLTGAVAPEEEDRLRSHADGCPSCEGLLARIEGLLEGPPRPPEPDDLARRRGFLALDARLRETPARLGWRPFAVAAVAALFALGIGLSLGGRQDDAPVRIASEPEPNGIRWMAPAGGSATYDLGGGTRIVLSEGATARVTGVDGPTLEIVLASGLLVGALKHEGAVDRIIIQAPRGRVEVEGTSFAVRSTRDDDVVAVAEGTVRVVSGRRSSNVSAGQARSLETLAIVDGSRLAPVWRLLGVEVAAAPAASVAPEPQTAARPAIVAQVAPPSRPSIEDVREARRAGDPARAITLAEQILSGSPSRADRILALTHLAQALGAVGRHAQAALTLETLADAASGTAAGANALFELGNVAKNRLGDPARADRAFARYLATSSSPPLGQEAYRARMQLAESGGRTAQARQIAAEYLGRYPNGAYTELAGRLSGR